MTRDRTDYRAALERDVALLEVRLATWRIYVAHMIPDMALRSFAVDVQEYATATRLVSDSAVPRAAYATVRGAIEAAQDALLLVSLPDAYDLGGAYIRAAELVEEETLRERFRSGDQEAGLEGRFPAGRSPEDIVREEGAAWDRESPGKGDLLHRALGEVRANGKRRRHWSGLTRKEIVETIQQREPGLTAFAKMSDPLYGVMSMQTHPGLRTGYRTYRVEDGDLVIAPRDSDGHYPVALAVAATTLLRAAIERRHAWSPIFRDSE